MDVVAVIEFKWSEMQRGWPEREGSRNKPVIFKKEFLKLMDILQYFWQ